MNTAEIQKRIDALPAKMNAAGLREPHVQVSLKANEAPAGYASWKDKKSHYGTSYEWIKGSSVGEIVDNLEAWVAALPDPEETRRNEFLTALSDVIQLGRENGIDVDFINPLQATMKRLSENAITDQRMAA